ncbi:MAG: peptidyl-prolyl cis-trans isomerase [Gemmatimonadota bacterium]
MDAFRTSAKPIIVAVTVTFFGWLVLDLSGITSGTGLLTRTSVGKINGRTVEAREYQAAVQQAIDARQRQGGAPLTLEETEATRNEVWEQFVQNALLEDEFKRRGITATADEVAEVLKNVPPEELRNLPDFQTNGQFDVAKYQRWLTSSVAQPYLPMLESQYRNQILRAKLFRAVTTDVYPSDAALWQAYKDRNEQVTVGLAGIIPAQVVPDSAVKVAPQEVESYYLAHKADFHRPRTAYLSYVTFSRLPDANDTAAAVARAQALREEILGGAPFAEVAKRESIDSVSAAKGGDLGEWTRGQFDPAFEEVAFSLPLNTVSPPVKSQFGVHLIQVYERSGNKAKARHILLPIELTGKHRDEVDARADSLERLGAERLDPAALDTAARVLKLEIGHVNPVVEGRPAMIGQLQVPDAGIWAFRAKKGETSPLIETPHSYYLFRVDSVTPAGTPPLAGIRGEVELALRNRKKAEIAKGKAEELEAKLAAGQALKEAAAALGLPYQEFGPFSRLNPPFPNPIVAGAAFGLAPGEHSPVITTPDGLYVLQSLSRQPADSAAFVKNLPQIRTEMLQQLRQQRVRGYLASLRAAAKVQDRREELQRTNAQIEAAAPPAAPQS